MTLSQLPMASRPILLSLLRAMLRAGPSSEVSTTGWLTSSGTVRPTEADQPMTDALTEVVRSRCCGLRILTSAAWTGWDAMEGRNEETPLGIHDAPSPLMSPAPDEGPHGGGRE